MQEIGARFEGLSAFMKAAVVTAGVVCVVLLALLLRGATAQGTALLYSGLEPAVAAEVIGALEADQIAYEVRGTSIFVPEGERDSLRLSLAGRGLPASGGAGYELLDSLSGFGTTSQMFDAAFRRAQEGELARTIAASPLIRSARVHLSRTEDAPFQRSAPATASVTVTMARGHLGLEHARTLRHLVASAVPNLGPEAVTIVDSQRGVVVGADAEDMTRLGSDRAAELRAGVLRLLEARVGEGRALVEVSVETQTDSETVTERMIDPDSRVAIHTDVEEDLEESSGTGPGPVTVASNLPDGDADAEGSSNSREVTRTRERVNYEVSEVLRERTSAPGRIARLTVAVLVDGIREVDGAEWRPRSEAEMRALGDLVRAAVGFDAARGDVLTIETLEFPEVAELGTMAASPPLVSGTIPLSMIVQWSILAAVLLFLAVFVIRPILRGRRLEELPAEPMAVGLPGPLPGQVPASVGEVEFLENMPEPDAEAASSDGPIGKLRFAVRDRRDESVELLRSWIDADLAEGLPK